MMYSEFIKISNFTEQYISFTEYTTYIEPIYMAADQIPTKQEFISLLRDAFKSLVHPVIEKAMHNLSLEDKAKARQNKQIKHIRFYKAVEYIITGGQDVHLPSLQYIIASITIA